MDKGDLAVIATSPQRRSPGPDSADPWPDFHYLTGLDHPTCGLILEKPDAGPLREHLFTPEPSSSLWDGSISPDQTAAAANCVHEACEQRSQTQNNQFGHGAGQLTVGGKKEKALGIPALFYFDSDRWCGPVNAFNGRSAL
jgi:hypothetical protein